MPALQDPPAGDPSTFTKVSILGSESITVGYGMTSYIAQQVVEKIPSSAYVIVTDTNIAPLHLNPLVSALKSALSDAKKESVRVLTYVMPPGESAKTREMKAQAEDWMLSNKCTRDSCILALGGGVIGDMFGFVAATFMRGIPVVQIPTTLLAMVDSSIGGKTAVDTPHGKNLVGAFHQPRHIYIDIKYLRTLPHREFVNGLAEVIKTAAIWDAADFTLLENHSEEILALSAQGAQKGGNPDHQLLVKVILGSVNVKAHVVTVDEKETGLRGLLNFGHSIGHAVEAILSPELLHGECVSIGMAREVEIARHLGYVNDVDVGRLIRCLQAYGLPVSVDDKRVKQLAPNKHCPVDQLLEIMKVDKKNQGDRKRIVMLAGIGKTFEPRASFIEDTIIRKILSPAMEVIPIVNSSGTSDGEVALQVPGSKSLSNRALVLAALGQGVCRLKGLLHSDDVQVMLDALQKLVGITYDWEDHGQTLVVTGGAGKLRVPSSEVYLGNAGTAARFLTTVCSLVPIASPDGPASTIVTGNARMKQRPIGPLVDALRADGCEIEYLESEGCLPLSITPNGKGLLGGHIKLSASISSQYVSSILLSAPYAAEEVTLELIGDAVISQPYIDMTISMMASFGVIVKRTPGTDIYHIPQGVYKNPATYEVEADASSATYPLAFAAITGSQVTVTNIGSKSLQGDAQFAVKVLKEMGCTVEQTETRTTVRGPKVLLPIPSIDMETMTDAFLTASVLAAVAQGGQGENITKIHGIANQRVKECNRIAAMVEQLAQFGVTASELPDGIQIHGMNRANLKAPKNGVKCYDDHRIAMSFSILSCVMPGEKRAVVLEKKCVEKTWPSWWDTLEKKLSVKLVGVDAHPDKGGAGLTSKGSDSKSVFNKKASVTKDGLSDATVVLIGMRGAGKTHMGQALARSLSRTFVDMDAYFEQSVGKTIPEFLAVSTWEEFRRLEAEQLQNVLLEHPTGFVVSCGGGIVETEAGRAVLQEWGKSGHVVHIRRDIKDIAVYLSLDKTRPAYSEDTHGVWVRRQPWYELCSTADFNIIHNSREPWITAERDLIKLVRFLLSATPQKPLAGATVVNPTNDSSFFLSLTFPNVNQAASVIAAASAGVDALELRVDLLEDTNPEFVGRQIALLRRYSTLPIIFTVRSKGQGGKFPDDDVDRMFHLLHWGLKWCCEFIDVEVLDVSDEKKKNLLNKLIAAKGNSHIIASYHSVNGAALWEEEGYGSSMAGQTSATFTPPIRMREKYMELYQYGDSIKLIGRAHKLEDNFALVNFVKNTVPRLTTSPKPLIALNMGPIGQVSRALNFYMTPVTHPSLPVAAAPGQLSVKEILTTRAMLGLIRPRHFYLFGTPISQSMSPTLHNTGFQAFGLPFQYHLKETGNWQTVRDFIAEGIRTETFGGASVTIPLKEDIVRFGLATELTEAAQRIKAVNTLTVTPSVSDGAPHIIGDNTDWLGIKASILKKVSMEELLSYPTSIGVVIGAGGTARAACYALNNLGVSELHIWNRTEEKAAELAAEFGGYAIGQFENATLPVNDSAKQNAAPRLILVVSTIPGPTQELLPIDAFFTNTIKGSPAGSRGVVVDMAYKPLETVMLEMTKAMSREGGSVNWSGVPGIEVLVEQGLEQFVRWTGRSAQRQVMEETVFKKYEQMMD
ncbi:3-dehydroquinate dehydratase (3-dehydroquinase) [Chytridiales sp. JEL 0842]|nr:3-dehydroquinate dehydratase (3-dehydroquinase) [Chytridiales sp. JEL 0842]